MAEKYDIRLSGTGGQGLILAGIILADAAILDGKSAVQTQSYGPEARGGASKAEVIISDGQILYPKVIQPKYLLLMSQEAARLYAKNINPAGTVIIDTTMVSDIPAINAKTVEIPITELAREEIGNELTANMLAIGAIAAAGNIVTKESLEKIISKRLAKVAALNIKAMNLGWELASKN